MYEIEILNYDPWTVLYSHSMITTFRDYIPINALVIIIITALFIVPFLLCGVATFFDPTFTGAFYLYF